MSSHALPYHGELLDDLHRAAAAAAAGRGQGRRLRRGRVLVAVRRRPCRPTPRSTRSWPRSRDAGVQLTGLNFFAGDMPGGDRGLVSWPGRQQEFRDNIDVVVGDRRPARHAGVQRALRQPGRRRDAGASRTRWPPTTWSPRPTAVAAVRRHRAGRAGQRRAALPDPHRGRRARRARPGPPAAARTTCGCWPTSTTCRSTATTSTTRAQRRPDRPRPDRRRPRPAASRAAASSTSTAT